MWADGPLSTEIGEGQGIKFLLAVHIFPSVALAKIPECGGAFGERLGGDAVVGGRRPERWRFPPRWVKYPRWQWDVLTSAQISSEHSRFPAWPRVLTMRFYSMWAKLTC